MATSDDGRTLGAPRDRGLRRGIVSSIAEMIARTPELDHHLLRTVREVDHTDGEGDAACASVEALPARPVAAIRAIRRAVRRVDPDVVHVHSSYAGLYARLALSSRRMRIVYTPHGYGFLRTDIAGAHRASVRAVEWLLTWNTTVLAACSVHEASLAGSGRRGMGRVTVPNVATIDPSLVERHRAAGRPGVLVACGRLLPIRDPDFFLQTVVALRERHPAFEARWLGGSPGPAAERLRAAGVEVTGWLPRPVLLAQLAEASVYVHTSAWDGFPMTLLEAVSIGVPTVARRIPQLEECPDEVVFDGPATMADEIARLLETPISEAEHRARWRPFLADHSAELQRRRLLEAYGFPSPRQPSPRRLRRRG